MTTRVFGDVPPHLPCTPHSFNPPFHPRFSNHHQRVTDWTGTTIPTSTRCRLSWLLCLVSSSLADVYPRSIYPPTRQPIFRACPCSRCMLLSTIAPFRRILSSPSSSPFNSLNRSVRRRTYYVGALPPLNHFLYSHPRALTPPLLVVLFSAGCTLEIAVVVYATDPTPLRNHSTPLCRSYSVRPPHPLLILCVSSNYGPPPKYYIRPRSSFIHSVLGVSQIRQWVGGGRLWILWLSGWIASLLLLCWVPLINQSK